jgi:hypothetical protein
LYKQNNKSSIPACIAGWNGIIKNENGSRMDTARNDKKAPMEETGGAVKEDGRKRYITSIGFRCIHETK